MAYKSNYLRNLYGDGDDETSPVSTFKSNYFKSGKQSEAGEAAPVEVEKIKIDSTSTPSTPTKEEPDGKTFLEKLGALLTYNQRMESASSAMAFGALTGNKELENAGKQIGETAQNDYLDSAKEFQYIAERGAGGTAKGVEGFVNALGYLGQMNDRNLQQQNAETLAAWGALTGSQNFKGAAEHMSNTLEENKEAGLQDTVSFGSKYQQNIQDKYANADITKTGQAVAGVSEALGGLLPSAAANALLPGSGLAVTALSAGGNAAQDAKASGASDAQALAYGTAVGGIEAATEKIFDGMAGIFGKGAADDVIESIAKKLAKSETAQTAFIKIADSLGEGFEEFISEYGQRVANGLIVGADTRTFAETTSDALANAIMGAVVGGVVQTAGGIVQSAAGNPSVLAQQAADVTLGKIKAEQKTAPNAVNGTEAEDYYFDESENNTSWRERTYTENGKTYVQSQDRQRMYEVPTQSEIRYEVRDDGSVVLDDDVLSNLSPKDYRDFAKAYAELNLVTKYAPDHITISESKPVTINSTGSNVIITQTGINEYAKKLRGKGIKNKDNVSSVLLLNKLIENATPVSSSDNAHSETGNPFTYYKSKFEVGGRTYNVTLHIKNVPSGDHYYYHALNGVDIEAGTKNVTSTYGSPARSGEYPNEMEATTSGDIITPDGAVVNSGDTESVGAAPAGFDPYSNMINQYGIIPEGESPARMVDLPKSTNGKDRVSYTARTAMEAEATPDSAVGELGESVLSGEFSYIPISNKQAETMARASIKRAGDFSAALANWTAEVRQGKTSAKLTAMGALLYNESVNSGNTKQAISILADYAAMVRHGAQAVQAARVLKTLSPQNKLLFIQQTVNKMNEQFNGKGLENLADIKGGINLDTTLINEYLTAKTEEARNAALDKIYQNIADQIPSNLMDKFTALRYLNMLGNLKTQVRNLLGNLINKGVRAVDHRLQAIFQAIYHHSDPSKRTTTFFRDPEIAKMAKADYENYRDVVMGEQKYSASAPSGKLASEIEDRRTIFKSNGKWGTSEATGISGSLPARIARWSMDKVVNPFFEGYRKLTSQAMDKGDEIFSKSAYADAMSRYLKAKGFTAEQWRNGSIPQETLDAARQYSITEAQEATFRDSNAFSDAISKVGFKNPQNGVQKAMNVVIQGTVPFRKTPANVAVQAEKHSPLGLINTAVNAVRASNSNDVDANDVIKSLSETLTGSGLVILGGALAAAGLATGGKDEDEKLAQIDDLTGGQEYAIVIPGVGSYTYDSLTPASMSFALGVEAYKAFERNGFTPSAFFEAVSGATDIMLNMSMLSGLNDAFENVSYSDTPLVDAALNSVVSYFTQGLTSTLGGQIERIFEDERMTTFRDKNGDLSTSAQYALGKTSAKTPGWDFQQIPYIDAWGRTEDSGGTVFRAFSNLLSPGYASKETVTEADEEIRRLANEGYTGAVPSNVEFSKKVDGEYMDAEQYTEYATVKGQTSFDLVSDMILSTVYKGMTDEEKAESIAKAYSYAGHVAAEEITDGKHESEKYVELSQDAKKDLGLSEAEYLLYYMKYGSDVMNSDAIRDAYNAGIAIETFIGYKEDTKGLKADKDANGKTINGSKKEKIVDHIDTLDIPDEAKDFLYEAAGYSASGLKDTPWH